MKTHAQHPVSTSRTLSGSPKASNQISMNELLQRGPVAQRMVGFEFQTVGGVWNVKKKDGQNWVDPGHGDLIDTLDKIKVTADGTDLEFITEPVDERKDTEINSLKESATNAYVDFETKITPPSNTDDKVPYNNYLINKLGERNAHPQATVGVKLENIIDLMEHVIDMPITTETDGTPQPIFGHSTFATQNTTNPNDKTSYAGKQRDAVKTSLQKTSRHIGKRTIENKKALGLITLIEHFIQVNKDANIYSGDLHKDYHTNAKNKMPIMPRTALNDIYKKIGKKARKIVNNYLMGEQGHDIVMSEFPNNNYTINDLRTDFKSCISKKKIILDQKGYHGIGDTENMVSNRTTDKSTDIGYDTPTERVEGGIFELRSLPNQIAPEQWGNVVTKVAQVIKEVNAIRTPTS